ncbi:MAG: hypothetical protein AAGB11_00620 [Pseudomonadota bacterium]
MRTFWALVAQTFLSLFGYCAALVAASIFAWAAIKNVFIANAGPEFTDPLHTFAFIASTALGALPASFVPALIAVAITEGFMLRGLFTHLFGGCLVGFAASLPIAAITRDLPLPAIEGDIIQLSAASGAVGGFVYWLIAGRRAGRWLERASADGRQA